MTNTSTDQNTNPSDENNVNKLWEILKPYKDKYLQVWWYGGMAKGKSPRDQPKVHVLFREVLEDFTPTDNFIQITTNITDLVSWRVDSIWHQQRKIDFVNKDIYEFVIDHTDFEFKFLKIYENVDEKKKINFLKKREGCEIVDSKRKKNCISFKLNHPEFDELLIPCLEFLTRAYGLSTELIRVLTTYNESERESRLYTPHIGEKGLWTVLLGDGITRADHVFVAYYKYTEMAKNATRILFSSIVENSNFKQANIYPKVVPWHDETLPIRVSGFRLAGTKTFVVTRIRGIKPPKNDHIRIIPKVTERINTTTDTDHPNPPLPQLGSGDINVSTNPGGRRPPSNHELIEDDFEWIDGGPTSELSKYKCKKQTKRPKRKKKYIETQTISTGAPDNSPDVLNGQIVPSTKDSKEFLSPEDGRIIGLWKACLKANEISPDIIQGVNYYTFEKGFDFSELPMLIGFFTESDVQAHKTWCYANSFKTQIRGALIIRLNVSQLEPIYIFDIQPAIYTSTVEGETLTKERGHAGLIFRMKQEKNLEQFISDLMYLLPLNEGSYPQEVFQSLLVTQIFLFRHSHTKGLTEGESTLLNALRKIGIDKISFKN
ncbi:hypothetical protein KTI78_13400 [Acinetobacter sp. WU_MDCI_Abxe161]|uniref:hypothetical protein n=1 Tax=Acinetobacter sp. WU_MDCI_Abxe161 TaxID=2850074 RepID=UPI0021CD322A|nr:hypothetical protein [Acinetobacter sp. WU_MDCI_Abxe161]MCU4504161.1 hypothetical protein [Acinetobacter sp. WU_MDCI_Abxe161]